MRGLERRLSAADYVLCGLVVVTALRSIVLGFVRPIDDYDEGLLLTDAFAMTQGLVPYRDFYVNYPPGPFVLLATTWKAFGMSVFTARTLGFSILLGGALGSGFVAGRIASDRFSWVAFASVLALQSDLPVAPLAYVSAVTLGTLCVLSVPASSASRARHAAHGFLFGAVAWFRHDLFVYTALALFAFATVLALVPKTRSLVPRRDALLAQVGGAALALALVFVPIVLAAGPHRVLGDLYFDQLRTLPARAMPFPTTVGALEVAPIELELPGVVGERVRVILLLTAATFVATLALLPRRLADSALSESQRLRMVWLVAFALGTVPHVVHRVDYAHVAYGVPFVIALLGVFVARRPLVRALVPVVVVIPLLAFHTPLARTDVFERIARARDDAAVTTPAQRGAVEIIAATTAPGDRIFVGCADHRLTLMSPMSLYYLSRRLGATRRMQFDPGLTTDAVEQRAMIRDLERTRPPLVLRFSGCFWKEPNASSRPGSSVLDQYLDTAFVADPRVSPDYRYAVRR